MSIILFVLQIQCYKNVFISLKIPTPKNKKTNNFKNTIIRANKAIAFVKAKP
jgi:hypothetical protein